MINIRFFYVWLLLFNVHYTRPMESNNNSHKQPQPRPSLLPQSIRHNRQLSKNVPHQNEFQKMMLGLKSSQGNTEKNFIEKLTKLLPFIAVNMPINEQEETALFIAAHLGCEEIVQCLLNAKAKPNLANKQGISPLHAAMMNGHAGIAALLIKHKALLPQTNPHRWGLFQSVVINHGHKNIFDLEQNYFYEIFHNSMLTDWPLFQETIATIKTINSSTASTMWHSLAKKAATALWISRLSRMFGTQRTIQAPGALGHLYAVCKKLKLPSPFGRQTVPGLTVKKVKDTDDANKIIKIIVEFLVYETLIQHIVPKNLDE